MTLLVEHLGGQIVWSSTDRLPPVSHWLQLGSQTKVANFQFHGLTHKKVTCGGSKGVKRSALDTPEQ